MNNMLGNLSLLDVQGPRDDFEQKLAGEQGEMWLAEFKHFLRKEPTWQKPQILNLIKSCIKFPGYPAFRVDDKIKLIKYRGSNFDEWFGGMEVAATPSYKIDENELTERALDTPILAELGEENCETSIAVLFCGIETGYWAKDRRYLLYAKDKNDVRRAVRWYWDGDGWYATAFRVGSSGEWYADSRTVSRTVSRKPLIV